MKSCCGCCFPLPEKKQIDVSVPKPPAPRPPAPPTNTWYEDPRVHETVYVDNSMPRRHVETRSYSPARDGVGKENLQVEFHQDVDWARESRANWEERHASQVREVVREVPVVERVVQPEVVYGGNRVVAGGSRVVAGGTPQVLHTSTPQVVHHGGSRVVQGGATSQVVTGGVVNRGSRVVQGGVGVPQVVHAGNAEVVRNGSRVVNANAYNPFRN